MQSVERNEPHPDARRRDALEKITAVVRNAHDPIDLAWEASRIVGVLLGASRCGYSRIEGDDLVTSRDWTAPGVESLAGTLSLRDFGSFIDDLREGDDISIADVRLDPRTTNSEGLEARHARAFLNIPIMENGNLVGVFFVNAFDVHQWSDDEAAFVREGADRIRTATERLLADAARQRAVEELRLLNAELERRVLERTMELNEAHEALRQSQKMEAVGQLTGGLAHDFNNLLAGIAGSLEMMDARLQQGRIQDIGRYMMAAQGAAKRAAALTHRLLAFSRRQTLDPRPTDVNRLVAGMQELIQRTVGPSVAVEVVGASGLWPALVDPSQLENALLNLCINARDAMPDGGRITIETGNKWLDFGAARQQEIPEGQYLSVCVTDTGVGMSAEIMRRVFEPFFTTKPTGEGTGLGLSMTYGFAQQSGGQVRIYSEVGQGTTVCIYLPRHHGIAEIEEDHANVSDRRRSEQGETVLVVDDEPTVRMLLADILSDLGYKAIEAGDGAAGLKVLQSDVRLDLLVTDVGLPGGMNGRQMADAAREKRPDLKVLFVTGYAENSVFASGLEPGMAVLTKPFAVETMATRIRAMIESD